MIKTLFQPIFIARLHNTARGRLGRDRIVVGFTSTYAISAYHHKRWTPTDLLYSVLLEI